MRPAPEKADAAAACWAAMATAIWAAAAELTEADMEPPDTGVVELPAAKAAAAVAVAEAPVGVAGGA